MPTPPVANLRNFAIVGHAAAGKTTLAEAMLVCAKEIGRMGTIEAGTTASDFHPSEKEHGISVHTSLLTTSWLDRKLNILDTPGFQDFIGEALSAVRVADFALVVIGANQGVAVGTDRVWAAATQHKLPKAVVINGMDRPNVDFEMLLEEARERYGDRLFPMTLPLDSGPGFHRLLDVMRNEVVTYKTDGSGEFTEAQAEGDDAARVKELHRQLIEFVAEADPELMERFFEQDGLSEDELRAGMHQALQEGVFVPVFATAAISNVGVARLLDYIAKYESSPLDHERVLAVDTAGISGEVAITEKEAALFVFKTMNEPGLGALSLFRVYAGTIRQGDELFNPTRGASERISSLYELHGQKRTAVTELKAGDIGAAVKLRDTHTGDTLCASSRQVVLPRVEYPQPNIHLAVRCETRGNEDKFAAGLSALRDEDPSFHYRVDEEIHQTIISGQGEIHLQIMVERLRRRFNVEVLTEEQRIAYRETIRGKADARYRHKKQTGGAGQFAEVWMRIAAGPRNSGIDFKQSLVGNNVDRVFVPSVEKGVRAVCGEGVLAKCKITDVHVDFYDGKMHPVDSKDVAFQVAGYHAFKEAFLAAKPCLLEPIFDVTVTVPEECVGDIIGDLSSRRASILGVEADGNYRAVRAHVPQRELRRYSTRLRSLTASRGVHVESFDHYAVVPGELEPTLIEEARSAREDR